MNITKQQHVKGSDTLRTMNYNLRLMVVVAVIFGGVFLWRKLPKGQQEELASTYQTSEAVADFLNLGSLGTIAVNTILEMKAKTKVRNSGKYFSSRHDPSLPDPEEAGLLLTIPRAEAASVEQVLTRAQREGGMSKVLKLMDQDMANKIKPDPTPIEADPVVKRTTVIDDVGSQAPLRERLIVHSLKDDDFGSSFAVSTDPQIVSAAKSAGEPIDSLPTPRLDYIKEIAHDEAYYASLFSEEQG